MAHLGMHIGLLVLAWACATSAPAQAIYRCGSSYSQQPCGDSAPLPLHDPRSPAQQAEARASAMRAGKEADRLEAERLALERAAMQRPPQNPTQAGAGGKSKKGKTPPADDAKPFTVTVHKPKPAKSKAKEKGAKPPANRVEAATP